jgi:hypothetical protein
MLSSGPGCGNRFSFPESSLPEIYRNRLKDISGPVKNMERPDKMMTATMGGVWKKRIGYCRDGFG